MMKKNIHYLLIFFLGALVFSEFIHIQDNYFINDFITDDILKGIIALQISVLWLYEYKFNLPMIIGPGIFSVKEIKVRNFFAITAIFILVASITFLIYSLVKGGVGI